MIQHQSLQLRKISFVPSIDRCPECLHVWDDGGPLHFHDCRYFSLDDDRDEENDFDALEAFKRSSKNNTTIH